MAAETGFQSQFRYCFMVKKQLCTDFDDSEIESPAEGSMFVARCSQLGPRRKHL